MGVANVLKVKLSTIFNRQDLSRLIADQSTLPLEGRGPYEADTDCRGVSPWVELLHLNGRVYGAF